MSVATMGRVRPALGPALGKAPLPVSATVLSAILHATLAIALVVTAHVWATRQPKTYVVNLVPALAAVGAPAGRAEAPPPTLPPREQPASTAPTELPKRDTAPASIPEMPSRARDVPLPDRALPPRAPADRGPAASAQPPSALPRADDKELPSIPSSTARRDVAPPVATEPPRRLASAPPPLGQVAGSPQGKDAVTVTVTSDFPYAFYINAVVRKVTERWTDRALKGRQPVAVVEIGRTGRVTSATIETTSGNPYYDQAALRAINEANPFPPLPEDYKAPVLRVHFNFNFAPDRG